jgi:SAM-dependent methyltransferase
MGVTGGGFGSRVLGVNNTILRAFQRMIYPPAPFVNIISKQDRKFIGGEIFKSGHSILDVGSGLSKGPGSWLWKSQANGVKITTLDIVPGPNIDIVADILNLPRDFPKFDVVVLQSVPEHIMEINLLFQVVDRIVKPSGLVYVEMPFLQGVHGDPDDYWRCTIRAFDYLLPNFEILRSGASGGPFGAIIWIVTDLVSNVLRIKTVNLLLRFVLRWFFAPFRYCDWFLKGTKAMDRLASENFVLLIKSNN